MASIPHKTQLFRTLLDLTFILKHALKKWESVNSATKNLAHPLALDQVGKVLPRLFHLLAWAPGDKGPIFFQKLDIKDGFWRCVVEEGAEWNFCYVLPKLDPKEPTKLVIPNCLQMGWCQSPANFCMGTETARDVVEELSLLPIGTLPEHKDGNKHSKTQ